MGTVGLNFGSASSGAGFDVAAAVTSILAIETGVETPYKAQIAASQAQDAAFTSLGTGLAALSTAIGSLTNFDGVLAAKDGSSSDTSILSLSSASASAIAGSHSVVVTSLASTSSEYSDSVANKADTLSGSLSLQVGSGSTQSIDIDGSNNTLASLAAAINSGSYGVSASVVTDTHGSRLSLVSGTGGSAGTLTLGGQITDQTTAKAINFTVGQPGADAQLTVDGLATTSASNTVTGAIPGVTFQLLAAQPNATVQIQITNDNASVVTALQSVVTAYNALATQIKTQEGNTAAGVAEPLFGDPTLALLQNQLTGALTGGKSGAITSIDQLGLSLGQDGQLTLDQSTLQSTLNSNYTDVEGYLQGTGGFGQKLTAVLNGLSASSPEGALALALAQNATRESGLNGDIASVEARAAIDKTTLTTELNLANQILQSIPGQLDQVNEIYSAVTGYGEKS